MNHIVAAHDLTPARLDALRVELVAASADPPETLAAHATGPSGASTWLAVVRPDRNVLGTSTGERWAVAAMGSGLRIEGSAGADPAAAELRDVLERGGTLTAPDDSVAVAVAGGGSNTGGGADELIASVGSGVHRLFVGHPGDGGTVVSSNLGLLRRLLGPDTGPDRSMEDFLLGYGFLSDDRTVHRGIRSLAPGVHRLDAGTDDESPAAHVTGPDGRSTPSLAAAADELHEVFTEVMDDLAGPRQDVAVLLGGLDSALVASVLARMGRTVTTYTFGFGDPHFEQRNVGLLTAAAGTDERWVSITPEIILRGLVEFGEVFAQPGPQPHYQVHTLHASRVIRADGFDRVFSGDGCDAVFLGYPMVSTRARLLRTLGRTPGPALALAMRGASTRTADRQLGHVARMARSTLGDLQLAMPERGHLPTRYLDGVSLARLRTGTPPRQTESVIETRHRLAQDLGDLDPVRLAFAGNAATGQSRVKVDGSVTATGLRQYSPYLDPRLRSFVSSLPIEYLRPATSAAGSPGKVVLIEMIRRHGLLPDELVDMPKQSPVDAPVDQWYAGPLRSDLMSLLQHLPFEWDRSYVDEVLRPKFVERQYRERVALGHHTFQVIGLLASYASFHR